jgi:hypothetical protein
MGGRPPRRLQRLTTDQTSAPGRQHYEHRPGAIVASAWVVSGVDWQAPLIE